MWPRLRLTKEESRYCSKYEEPGKAKMPVLHRKYPGELNITSQIRQDQETLQISRRSRVFGLTASGDVSQFEIMLIDISGEQYTTDFMPLSGLVLGSSTFDPRSTELFNNPGNLNPGWVPGITNSYISYAPYIFEPNLLFSPNQTLTIQGRPIDPEVECSLHVEFFFHVWEFPGMPGSPI
jgi:hypothetical protein